MQFIIAVDEYMYIVMSQYQ